MMEFGWLAYAPEIEKHGCSPPPDEQQCVVARMHMLARFLPGLPLECTYPLLLADPDPCVRNTIEWKSFKKKYGARIAAARKQVCLVTNSSVAFSPLAAVEMRIEPAGDVARTLLGAKFFHAAATVLKHLRRGGVAHLITAQVTQGAVTIKTLENTLCLKSARAIYLEHPDAGATIVLLPRGFTAEVLNFHVNRTEAKDCEWKQWAQGCAYAPARPDSVPTPEMAMVFSTMVRAVRRASTDRARWNAAQMLAPHAINAAIARQMYDIVCGDPSILERNPALHEILIRLANGSSLDNLKVKQDGTTLGAWIYVYAACEESAIAHLRIEDHLYLTSVRWKKQTPHAVSGARRVTPVNAERAFLLNQIE